MTRQVEAFLMLAEYPLLKPILIPRLDVKRETVQWHEINYGVLSGGQRTALSWAWCIWNDTGLPSDWQEYPGYQMRDLFSSFGNMNQDLQCLILKALAHRHGLSLEVRA